MPPDTVLAHCSTCHLTFGSPAGFDKHRYGPADARSCRTPVELRELSYEPNDLGAWRIPRTDVPVQSKTKGERAPVLPRDPAQTCIKDQPIPRRDMSERDRVLAKLKAREDASRDGD